MPAESTPASTPAHPGHTDPGRTDPDPTVYDLMGTDGDPPARPRPHGRLAALGALLVVGTALPASVLTVPDATAGVVPDAADALGLDDAGIAGLLRATGLALPALVLAVPLAGLAARRLPTWAVLAAGLLALLAGLGLAWTVGSVPAAGTVRALQGAGAGIALPAALVLAWERGGRAAPAAVAGVLAAGLLLATPLVLTAVPQPPATPTAAASTAASAASAASTGAASAAGDWRAALAPWTWPAVVALAAVLALRVVAGRARSPLPAPRPAERAGLGLPAAPCAAFALLAVVAAHGWSPGARLVVAGIAVVTLLGLAVIAARDAATGGPFGCAVTMVAVGLLVQPVAGPLAGITAAAAHARGGAGTPELPPFAAGAAAALAMAALATAVPATRVPPRGAVLAGHGLMLAALPAGLLPGAAGRWTPLLVLVPLGAGAGLALAAALRDTGVGAALFGLSLCFPAVLAGQLAALSLQAAALARLRPETDGQRLAGLVQGQHAWLAAAAVAGAATAVLAARTTRTASRTAVARSASRSAGSRTRPAAGRHCAATTSRPPSAR